jgi:hypothetical protein
MSMNITYDTISEKIAYIERAYNVDSIALPDGTKVWNLIRVVLFSYPLKTEFFMHENKNKMKKLIFLLKEAISLTKLPRDVEIIAVSDVDTQKKIETLHYDVFMDPLQELFENYIVLDWPSAKAERYPVEKNHIPLKIPFSVLIEKVIPITPSIKNKELLENIIKEFAEEFNIDSEKLIKHVSQSIAIFTIIKEKMKKKLKKINPSIVFIRAAYGRFQMGIVQSCKELGITTIELQHGLIYNQHVGYVKRKKSENSDCVPDFIFTWGDYFSDIIRRGFLFKKKTIRSVGFPHIENILHTTYPRDKDIEGFSKDFENTILISGQERGDVDVFIKKAAQLNNTTGFIYKPHPRDVKTYCFQEKNILLIDRKKDIYPLLASVDIHMTVFSTTMMESFAFGVPNILVSSEDIDVIKLGIIDNETTYFITTPAEMNQAIENITKTKGISKKAKKKAETYFKKHALKNIEREIKIIRNL